MKTLRKLFPLLPLLIAGPACAATVASPPTISACWIRALPDEGAAYFTISNDGDKPAVLTGIDVQGYGMSMLHQSMVMNGKSMMMAADNVSVPAQGSLSFTPGGYHGMLMNAAQPPAPGTQLALKLKFKGGATATASCKVKGPDATGPD